MSRKIVIDKCEDCLHYKKTVLGGICDKIKAKYLLKTQNTIPTECPLENNEDKYKGGYEFFKKEFYNLRGKYFEFRQEYWEKESTKWGEEAQEWIQHYEIKIVGDKNNIVFHTLNPCDEIPISLILQLTGEYGMNWVSIDDTGYDGTYINISKEEE